MLIGMNNKKMINIIFHYLKGVIMIKKICIFILMIMFVYSWNTYVYATSLLSDISNTYSKLQTTKKYKERISLVDELVQRNIRIRSRLFSKNPRSNEDIVTIFQITALEDIYNELKDETSSSDCLNQLGRNAYRLYPGQMESLKELPDPEKKIYNLYGKMCSTSFKPL